MNSVNVEELNVLVRVTPTGDRVLIIFDKDETVTTSGILLANVANTSKNTGTVLAVGDFEGIRVKPGQRVIFEKGMGSRFMKSHTAKNPVGLSYTAQHELVLVPYFDIIAIMEG